MNLADQLRRREGLVVFSDEAAQTLWREHLWPAKGRECHISEAIIKNLMSIDGIPEDRAWTYYQSLENWAQREGFQVTYRSQHTHPFTDGLILSW